MNWVAIDGPAGAGKSTIAKEASKKLGFIYVDTGALYRAIALHIIRTKKDYKNKEDIINELPNINISLEFKDREQHVILCGDDVSSEIRSPQVSMAASSVSAIKEVRDFLLSLQRNIALKNNVIMDGRDIGTVVLPESKIKIFLTASPEKRAERRYKELILKGKNVTYQDVLDDINQRDFNDQNREIAPLKPAKGAEIIDTSNMTLDESINYLVSFLKERLN